MSDTSLGILILQALGWLLLLAFSSELLAKGAHILEKKFGAGFTGSVILGFITMLPELIFVLVAVNAAVKVTGAEQTELLDVALGSAVGGNILLFTLGYGMVILLAYYKHNQVIKLPRTLKDDLIYLLVASLYVLLTSLKGYFNMIDGIILTGLYLVFSVHQYFETKNLPKEGSEEDNKISSKEWVKNISLLLLGAIGIIIAAEPFVHDIIAISDKTGISPIILALIISPIASELPEKISAFALTTKSIKGAEVAVASFIGSKVQASTLLFGLMIIVKISGTGSNFQIGTNFIQLMLAVLTTLVGVWITYDLKLKLKEGWIVMGLYVVSVTLAIISIR